jgi:uncharacterized protein
MMDWQVWESKFEGFVQAQMVDDAAHDLHHVRRVVRNALWLAKEEGAQLEVAVPAAWLHDCVGVPKNSPQRPYASQLAAETAVTFLQQQNYPAVYLEAIAHAIAAHSFSAGIPPQTIEAKVVQDADRLEAIGAIGIARCFAVGGMLARPLYHTPDPFCQTRPPDDSLASVDHFYTKLLKLADTMQTTAGREEAYGRTQFMLNFLAQLKREMRNEK